MGRLDGSSGEDGQQGRQRVGAVQTLFPGGEAGAVEDAALVADLALEVVQELGGLQQSQARRPFGGDDQGTLR